jgi:DHA1 family bicyclomycin/chloramphenicol resistance-like MFS transporter
MLYAALVFVSAVGPLALNMFMPSIPGLVSDLDTTSGMAQLTMTIYLIGSAIGQLIYGPLSDRFGRRPLMLAGGAIFVTTSILCAFATSIEFLITARFLQSLGGSAGMVLSRAIIRDLHDEKAAASVIGYITMAWVLAPMLAPTLGGYLDQWASWRASFWVLSGFGMLALSLAFSALPETNQTLGNHNTESRLSAYKRLLGNRRFLILAAMLSLTSAVFFSFLGGATFLMIEVLDQTPLGYGLWFMVVSVGYMSGNFLSGRFSGHVGTHNMIVIGLVMSIIGTGIMFYAAITETLTPALIFLPMSLVAVGNGVTLPNGASAILSTDAKAIGSAAGLAGFLQAAAGAAAAQLVGNLQPTTPMISIWFMFSGSILATLIYSLVRHR